MGRPLRADGRQTRQAILDAALDLFAENGYFGTSLREIARAVGVRESAFYNYFPGKEALFHALIAAGKESHLEQLAPLLEGPADDPRAVLEQLAAKTLDAFSAPRQQKLFRVLMSDGMRLAREGRLNFLDRMTSGAERLEALMRRLIAAGGLRPGDPELLMTEFMGPLLLWRHRHALRQAGPLVTNRTAFVRAHVDHFLNGAMAEASNADTRRPRRQAAGARRRRRVPEGTARV
jgi:AcrR family transcriptional regulator